MALLTTQTPTEAGTAITFASCNAGGDTFSNNGKTYLHVKNGSGGAITVTIPKTSSATVEDDKYGKLTKADAGGSVAAGAHQVFGPFKPSAFNAVAGTGIASITYSAVTSLTIAVIQS